MNIAFLPSYVGAGITQEQAAEQIGLQRVQIERLLNWKSNDIPDSWRKLLELVGMDWGPVKKID